MNRKLKSQNGESIAEVLVATLIAALATVMFASMVTASDNLIRKSDDAYKEYLQDYNDIEGKNPEGSKNLQKGKDDSVKISSEDESVRIQSNTTRKITLYTDKNGRYFIYGPGEETGQ